MKCLAESTHHVLYEVEPDEWYVLIGPDTDDFDLAGLWDEHNPSRHGAWECWMETADDGCLIVHLLAPCP